MLGIPYGWTDGDITMSPRTVSLMKKLMSSIGIVPSEIAEPVTGFSVSFTRTTAPGEPLSERDRLRPSEARARGRKCLRGWGLDGLGDSVELLLSELVTNGFRHGHGPVVVSILRADDAIRIEVVSGGGAQVPCVREAGVSEESGRGLWLVDAVADAWGVTADGSCTWCLLAVSRPA